MAVNKACMTRLQKEYKALIKEPVPCVEAHPSPNNLLEWHFILQGKDDFEGGVYHGKITFPTSYPYKPPSILMYTPNGRFATNTKICMSMTDFHPESWNPMWSVGTILTGMLSFMYDTANSTGVVTSTPAEKRRLAAESLAFNVRSPTFRKIFPEWVERHAQQQRSQPAAEIEAQVAEEEASADAPEVPAPAPELAQRPQEAGPGMLTYYAAAAVLAGGAILYAATLWSSGQYLGAAAR